MLLELIVLQGIQPYGEIYRLILPRNSLEYRLLCLYLVILLTNKRVHREASPLLYSRNSFRLDKGYLTLFLDYIGPQNVSFLCYIYITFLAFDDYYYLESVTLKEDSICTLERICDNYTNLTILETLLRFWTINIIESTINTPNSPRVTALLLVDTRFKVISSLKEIIINIYDILLSYDLREKIRSYGQIIEGIWEESESVNEDDDYQQDNYYCEDKRE